MKHDSDAHLVEMTLNNQTCAFDELVKRYQGKVYGWLSGYLLLQCDKEDVSQHVFITAFDKLATLRNPAQFSAWLRRIAINSAKTGLRKGCWDIEEFAVENIRDEDEDGFDIINQAEVRMVVNDLPQEQLDVVTHYYFASRGIHETARLLKINKDLVKSRLFKARRNMKKGLLKMNDKMLKEVVFELNSNDLDAIRGCVALSTEPKDERPELSGFVIEVGGRIMGTSGCALITRHLDAFRMINERVTFGNCREVDIPKAQHAEMVLGVSNAIIRGAGFEKTSLDILTESQFPEIEEETLPVDGALSFDVSVKELLKCVKRLEDFLAQFKYEEHEETLIPLVHINLCLGKNAMSMSVTGRDFYTQGRRYASSGRCEKYDDDCFFGVSTRFELIEQRDKSNEEIGFSLSLPLFKHIVSSLGEEANDGIRFLMQADAVNSPIKLSAAKDPRQAAVVMAVRGL